MISVGLGNPASNSFKALQLEQRQPLRAIWLRFAWRRWSGENHENGAMLFVRLVHIWLLSSILSWWCVHVYICIRYALYILFFSVCIVLHLDPFLQHKQWIRSPNTAWAPVAGHAYDVNHAEDNYYTAACEAQSVGFGGVPGKALGPPFDALRIGEGLRFGWWGCLNGSRSWQKDWVLTLKVGCLWIKWLHGLVERQENTTRDGGLGSLMKRQVGDMRGKNAHVGNASSRHSRPCWAVAPNRSSFCWTNLSSIAGYTCFFCGIFMSSGYRWPRLDMFIFYLFIFCRFKT